MTNSGKTDRVTDRQPRAEDEGAARGIRHTWMWLNRRTGINSLLHEALDEPIPGGARLAYIFGSGLLFLFLSQVITGVFLSLYYVPSADHAHVTVAYMVKVVTAGSFLRSIHAYGASAMIIVLLLHVTQVFVYGSYKGRRELLWISGIVLFLLVFGMAFTGYLLPWDQKAYFATAVGTNLVSEVPLVGGVLKHILRGGAAMGTLTVSRFFVAHVFLLPAAIFAFVAIHIYLFRKAGAAGPTTENPVSPKQKAQTFYPRQLLLDMGFTLVLIVALGALAHFKPVPLAPEANPANTQYLPRPEWYYRPMFQGLKYFTGPMEIVGILVVPSIIMALFIAAPFLDRSPERRPWKRPVAMSVFAILLFSFVALGAVSYWQDMRDPAIAAQLRKQQQQEDRYMSAPFKPHLVGAAVGQPAPRVNPLIAKGRKIFEAHVCTACHGQNAEGTAAAPSLIGIGSKFPPDKLASLLRHPTKQMTAGGMPPVDVSDEELKELIAYLESLK